MNLTTNQNVIKAIEYVIAQIHELYIPLAIKVEDDEMLKSLDNSVECLYNSIKELSEE